MPRQQMSGGLWLGSHHIDTFADQGSISPLPQNLDPVRAPRPPSPGPAQSTPRTSISLPNSPVTTHRLRTEYRVRTEYQRVLSFDFAPPPMLTTDIPFFADPDPWPDSPSRLVVPPHIAAFSPNLNAPLPSPPPDSGRFLLYPLSIPSPSHNNFSKSDPEDLIRRFKGLNKSHRFAFLSALVGELRLNEALVVSRRIEPRLRRDFLRELPLELALHCLSFVGTTA